MPMPRRWSQPRTLPGATPGGHVPVAWSTYHPTAHEEAWRARAACAAPDIDPEVFFPEPGPGMADRIAAAQRVCAGCPVRKQCRDYAQRQGERHGIWGGHSTRTLPRSRGGVHTTTHRRAAAVARLSRAGLTVDQIADRLQVTVRTVGRYRARPELLDHPEAA
ncbi:WhiB family redox-sensing transcriptional regulator [Saccharomonospora amisosensis]|uniref:Transcriptional regulator WhiB n=1 Tax=Saccharomonospora amisosensis TaxID=1128677 RepID=A0A7X5UU69_9PSEU|nr:WhiB family transcriptional regulator [Saccharomonospora amisosensis]NIJ14311.1 WhiB family redox-sensing transcriptional regulator [Saccharomonospora amisosensis]